MTSLLCLFLGLLSPAAAAEAKVDAGHSAVLFKVHHFGAGYTWGRFNDFSGTVTGPLADLEVGPVARNMIGARRVAERIVPVAARR